MRNCILFFIFIFKTGKIKSMRKRLNKNKLRICNFQILKICDGELAPRGSITNANEPTRLKAFILHAACIHFRIKTSFKTCNYKF